MKKNNNKTKRLVTKSEIAKATGLKPISILFYLKRGLIKPTKKSDTGYYLFDKKEIIKQIEYIKELQANNFSLYEISGIFREKRLKEKLTRNIQFKRNFVILSDVATIIKGPIIQREWRSNKGRLIISSRNLFKDDKDKNYKPRLDPKFEKYIFKACIIKEKDILISVARNYMNGIKALIAGKNIKNAVFDALILKIEFKKDANISPEFFKLYIEHSDFCKEQLQNLKHGRMMPFIPIYELGKLKIPILTEKEKIEIKEMYAKNLKLLTKLRQEIKTIETTTKKKIDNLMK